MPFISGSVVWPIFFELRKVSDIQPHAFTSCGQTNTSLASTVATNLTQRSHDQIGRLIRDAAIKRTVTTHGAGVNDDE